MALRLRSALSAAAAYGRLLRHRALSAEATSRPQWGVIVGTRPVKSPALRATFHLAEPPRASRLLVPAHLLGSGPLPGVDRGIMGALFCDVRAVSADGFLLLNFLDIRTTGPVLESQRADPFRDATLSALPEATRFVCNPLSGELFRLPDIDGTKKTLCDNRLGLLTKARRGHGPPDRYAVAELLQEKEPSRCFSMRRFLSETGEWEKLTGLPSPLPLPLARRMEVDHEAVAFGGRLWWVDGSCGAVSADPFSDRPELRFVELPEGKERVAPDPRTLCRYRRVGVSEGRLRYAVVSQWEPFVLRSFALDGDDDWTLEHEVALSPLWTNGGYPWLPMEETPRIAVIDPMNASIMHLTIGNYVVTVDMDRGKVVASAIVSAAHQHGLITANGGFFRAFLLSPWLGSSRIPRAGKPGNARNKTLADVLIRSN
ncbi:uncharacterized protein LOC119304820 [Triticum dicoccoides]|uniref:uncharacterized protein LOC119304820 n=1 Tax=Triticum dicoccoides TaxID=85692 RepID=UPI00162B6B45|nr:uncharacterized protein LOC119304820 [Triticum dicoccoides]